MIRALVVALYLAAACGQSHAGGTAAPEELPPTDRDPPPYIPAPTDDARTGGAVGIATSGGFEQARIVALRFIEAVRDADREALEQQLGETIARVRPRLMTPNVPRAQMIELLVSPGRRRVAAPPEVPLDQLVDTSSIVVIPLAQHEDAAELPNGLLPTDLQVTVPMRDQGRPFLGAIWNPEGRLIVRPGPEPRIIGL